MDGQYYVIRVTMPNGRQYLQNGSRHSTPCLYKLGDARRVITNIEKYFPNSKTTHEIFAVGLDINYDHVIPSKRVK